MRILAIILTAAILSGCATWNGMTDREQRVAVGTAIGALVIGALAADDGDTYVTNTTNTTHCSHPAHCEDR